MRTPKLVSVFTGFVLGLCLTLPPLRAQGQITAPSFVNPAAANTWTADQTFNNITVTGTCSGCTGTGAGLTGSPASGNLAKFSGTTTLTSGDLSGDISTSGSLVTAIGAAKVTNAMLAGSITAAKLVGTDIATVGTLTAGQTGNGFIVAITPVAVASLPSVPTKGQVAYVTDSNTVTFHATVAGGGVNNILVVYDGTNWKVGG